MKKQLLITILLLSAIITRSQHKLPAITPQDKDQIEAQADMDVQDFCFYLPDLAKKETKQKDSLKVKLLRLFADSSTIVVKADPKDNGTAHPVWEYLNQVEKYSKKNFQVVAITFDQVMVDVRPENLQQKKIHGQMAYVGKFSFVQHFRMRQAENAFNMPDTEVRISTKTNYTSEWGDDTRKYGEIIIIPKKASARGPKYKVLLGDITAGEVDMVKKKRVK